MARAVGLSLALVAISGALRPLVSIPVVDFREGGLVGHARNERARARALGDECLSWLPRPARAMLPALDAITRGWLRRSYSPYIADVEAIAATLDFPGIWFLNGSYQWGCTTVARDEDGVPWLARTLRLAIPGAGAPSGDCPHARPRGRLHQRDLARLCRNADGVGARAVRGRDQPGAALAPYQPPVATAL